MITKVINVNLHQPIYEKLTAKQGDIASRYLLFHLLDGDKPFDLSNRTVRVYAIKPDKTEIFNDLAINDASKGYCTLELTSQCLASAGVVKMELYISESGKVLTSIPFELEVIPCINTDNGVISTNEFSALEVALSSLQGYDNLRREIVQARKGHETVGKRLDNFDSQLELKADLTYVDTKIGNMGNTKTFKGSCMFSALPTEANVDDYWYVTDKSTNYCWNGTTWVDIGDNLNIGDGTITTSKLAFAPVIGIKSKNLFNKETVTTGYYVDYTTGKLLSNDSYSASEFIMVESNTQYCKNTTHQFAFYDVNKTYISGINTDKVFTTPSNCRYVRLSVKDSTLNSLQFEKGSVQSDYVDFNYNLLDINTVPNKSITKEKLAFSTVELEKSKNLFNKETVTTGYYVDYRTGKLLSNDSYSASDYIEVESDTIYSKVTTNQFAFYDVNKTYISGINTDKVFTTPSNCKFIRISVKNESLDSEMLVENDNVGTYESFGSFIPKDLLPQEILKDNIEYTNFVIVSKDNPQLDTINKALNNLKGVDSVDNPCVILVMPGVYEESLILAYRYISIIGVDKDTCIITNKLNDYYNPPVDLTPNSHLKNLTIIADNDGIVEIPDVGTPGQQSYAVHFDSAGRYYNSKTEGVSRIENCILISNNYQALGSGLCINQKLICENVEFRAYKNNNAMRIHNYSLEGGGGSSAVFKDCTFISENAEPIYVQNVNDNNIDTEITFIRNVAYNNNGQVNCLKHQEVIGEGCISGNIILGKGSFGNSIAELNK